MGKDLTDGFFAAYGDTLRIKEFLSPLTAAKVRREAKARREDHPVFGDYEERATTAWSTGRPPQRRVAGPGRKPRLSLELEAALGELVGSEHVVLFPTGWAAGYGAIAALIRPDDHVVLDRYAHACLQQGAISSTRNVHRFAHCDTEAAEERLEWIRRRDAKNAILVVTEGLFSMDADWPGVEALQAVCQRYGATLLVDVAHDLGSAPGAGRPTGSRSTRSPPGRGSASVRRSRCWRWWWWRRSRRGSSSTRAARPRSRTSG